MKTEKEIKERINAIEVVLEGSDFSDVTPRFKRELSIKAETLNWVLGIKKKENETE